MKIGMNKQGLYAYIGGFPKPSCHYILVEYSAVPHYLKRILLVALMIAVVLLTNGCGKSPLCQGIEAMKIVSCDEGTLGIDYGLTCGEVTWCAQKCEQYYDNPSEELNACYAQSPINPEFPEE